MSQSGRVSIPGLTFAGTPQSVELSSSNSKQNTAQPPKKGRKSKHALRKVQDAQARAEAAAKPTLFHQDTRTPPTQASGGVPDPIPQYITRSLGQPSPLTSPRRILIVMDLNGTLLYRPSRHRPSKFVERPHARRFLEYCLDTFYVAIWSSARPENVQKMVASLLTPDQCRRCLLVWGRDQFGLSPEDYDLRVQVYKRLSHVWDDAGVMSAHPDAARGGRWDQSNTVLVDDSLEKGRTEPFNILALPEFSGVDNEKAEVLPQVHDYLNLLCWQSDISRYMRQNPFKLNPNYSLPRK